MKPIKPSKIDYEYCDGEFEVWLEFETEVNIRKFCIFVDGELFYDWLYDTNRLDWELNWPDHTGTHVQRIGIYNSLAEYLDEMPRTTVEEDLFIYIHNANALR